MNRPRVIVDVATRLGVPATRGSEDDVLDRYVNALLDDPTLDYVSNTLHRTYPRGLDVEVLTRTTLETAAREATEPTDRERVTRYVWRQPERFRLGSVTDHAYHSHLRWTVDEPADLALVREGYRDLLEKDPAFGYAATIQHTADFPALHARNRAVVQKHE